MLLQSYSGFKLKHSQELCIKLENVYKLNLCYSNIECMGRNVFETRVFSLPENQYVIQVCLLQCFKFYIC
jgi:hypothetical protein